MAIIDNTKMGIISQPPLIIMSHKLSSTASGAFVATNKIKLFITSVSIFTGWVKNTRNFPPAKIENSVENWKLSPLTYLLFRRHALNKLFEISKRCRKYFTSLKYSFGEKLEAYNRSMAKADNTLIQIQRITPSTMGLKPTCLITSLESPAPIRNKVNNMPIFA